MKHVCDVCRKRAPHFVVLVDVIGTHARYVDSFEKGILEKEAGKGTKNIMRKWREKARQSSIRVERRLHAEQQQRRQQLQQQQGDGSGEAKWEMPTQPTRICQLPNGWIECWIHRQSTAITMIPKEISLSGSILA